MNLLFRLLIMSILKIILKVQENASFLVKLLLAYGKTFERKRLLTDILTRRQKFDHKYLAYSTFVWCNDEN